MSGGHAAGSAGRLVVAELVSLDGVMEAPGGEPGHPHTGWARDYVGPEQIAYKLDELLEAQAMLFGRVTYQSFAAAWPQRTGPVAEGDQDLARVTDQGSVIGRMADRMTALPKHVVSTTLRAPAWSNTRVISGDVPAAVARLKAELAGPLLVNGSRTLVHTLFEQDLVDEYRLMILPVVLGSGGRLFPQTPRKTVLELVDVRRFSTGAVVQTYRTASAGRA